MRTKIGNCRSHSASRDRWASTRSMDIINSPTWSGIQTTGSFHKIPKYKTVEHLHAYTSQEIPNRARSSQSHWATMMSQAWPRKRRVCTNFRSFPRVASISTTTLANPKSRSQGGATNSTFCSTSYAQPYKRGKASISNLFENKSDSLQGYVISSGFYYRRTQNAPRVWSSQWWLPAGILRNSLPPLAPQHRIPPQAEVRSIWSCSLQRTPWARTRGFRLRLRSAAKSLLVPPWCRILLESLTKLQAQTHGLASTSSYSLPPKWACPWAHTGSCEKWSMGRCCCIRVTLQVLLISINLICVSGMCSLGVIFLRNRTP